jgi:hypothetical protein
MFKKGQSGNPGGRPKGQTEVKALISAKHPDLIARLFAIALHGEEKASVSAIKELLDRSLGKPTQAIDVSGSLGLPAVVEFVTPGTRSKK